MGCSFKEKSSSTNLIFPPKNQVTLPSKTACAMPIAIVTLVHRPRSSHGVRALPQGKFRQSETEGEVSRNWRSRRGAVQKKNISYLELATSIHERLFQSDDSKFLHRKWWLFHHFHPFETGCFGFQVHRFKELLESQLPSLKLTFSHLKMDGWKMSFPLGPGLFSGAKMLVSGRVALNSVSIWRDYWKSPAKCLVLKFEFFDQKVPSAFVLTQSCNFHRIVTSNSENKQQGGAPTIVANGMQGAIPYKWPNLYGFGVITLPYL